MRFRDPAALFTLCCVLCAAVAMQGDLRLKQPLASYNAQIIHRDIGMADAAPQPVSGAAAAALAPAQQPLTLPAFRTILREHIDREDDAVTPLI